MTTRYMSQYEAAFWSYCKGLEFTPGEISQEANEWFDGNDPDSKRIRHKYKHAAERHQDRANKQEEYDRHYSLLRDLE